MPKKQELTVTELKSLLLARFNADRSKQVKLHERLQQALGIKKWEEKPETTAIQNRFTDRISDLLAHRLKRNRRSTPLFSYRDFARFVHSMVSEIVKIEGDELEAKDRKTFEEFIKALFKNAFDRAHLMIPPRKNLYAEYWRWATTALDFAAERGIPPTKLLAIESANDEITRRMYTKSEFVALTKKAMNKSFGADMLKKNVIQPMLDMVAGDDKEERHKLERELKTELMPQLNATIKKSRAVVNAWLDEEVGRIYLAA